MRECPAVDPWKQKPVRRPIAWHLLAACAWSLLVVGSYWVESGFPHLAPFWPAAGIALAARIRLGRHVYFWLPAVSAGSALAAGLDPGAALITGVSDTVVIAVAAWLLGRLHFSPSLQRTDDVFALAITATLAPIPAAMLAALVPGVVADGTFTDTFRLWWISDGLGLLVVTPTVLTSRGARRSLHDRRALEFAVLGLLLAATVGALFLADLPDAWEAPTNSLLLFPLLIWAAMRFGPGGAAWASLLAVTGAHAGAALGTGAWAHAAQPGGGFGLGLFELVATATALVLAAMNLERLSMQVRLAQTQRLASIGTLAAGVAHEINNPLAFVSSNLQFVADELEGRAEPGVRHAIDDALEGADRIRDIVSDLSIFSHGAETRFCLVELEQPIRSAQRMVSKWMEGRARLRVELRARPWVLGDAGRLGQVILNLLINAAQSIPAHRQEREVSLLLDVTTDGMALIEIRDTGKGIPPEEMERIFDPFYTTKPVGEGTGLGLAITHEIVTAHRGEIHVDSKMGQGTTMRVLLPLATAPGRRGEPTVQAA